MIKKDERLAPNGVCGSERSEVISIGASRWEDLVKELKMQWWMMWHDRIDDKVRAEGITSQDYLLLFLTRGTIIIATRKYRPPDFVEILNYYREAYGIEGKAAGVHTRYVNPIVGGWTKFMRDVLKRQPRFSGARIWELPKSGDKERHQQQKKKGGRGWVHRF